MNFNKFAKKPLKAEKDDCKIRIKKSPDGSKTVTFKGNCTREQISMAKENE